ncbi:unnamed protein product [Adineta steineri]|uniref:Uncharacterized protein n=1 Tax=Adineta steineri TaxID=433720 RepID=A0A814SY24_9BILA|nr:unnamed protein product [Adineta steineri]CAF1340754.1 unnamed protein product [Adineta steineri]
MQLNNYFEGVRCERGCIFLILEIARNLLNRLWQSFLELNLFKKSSSNEQTLRKERLATRIYLGAFVVCLIAIITAAALVIRTAEKTEHKPSYTRFSQLKHAYSKTLHCSCSKLGINYGTFVTTQVIFHQVCSSQFIQQTWIDMLFTNKNISIESINDFRVILSFFWQTIAGLCTASNKTWIDVVASFETTRILTPTVPAEEIVRRQAEAALKNQIALSKATLNRNLLAIRRIINGNQIVSALQTNFYLYYSSTDMNSEITSEMKSRMFGNCSCLRIEGCPHPAIVNNSNGHLVPIPGMVMDCLIIDATLASTLECYYNQSCLVLSHRSLPIDIQLLSNSSNKYFSVYSTIQTLVNELMIDETTCDIRFELYYSQCNPTYCSYSYKRRFDILFIFTTIIGIFGILSFTIKLIAPLIVVVMLRFKKRVLPIEDVPHVRSPQQNRYHVGLLLRKLRHIIVTCNCFERETPRTSINIYREQLLTRFFIFLMLSLSASAGLYTFLVEQNHAITIVDPPLATYEQLHNDHPITLHCPCSKISIPHRAFLNVTFVLHQVCSSDLVSSEWLNYLISFDPYHVSIDRKDMFALDFRAMGASYFQLLAIFCSLVQINIADAQRLFSSTEFINDRVLVPSLFIKQTQTMIDSFIRITRKEFIRTFHWISVAFITNHFFNGAGMNFDMTIDDNDTVGASFASHLVLDIDSNGYFLVKTECSCGDNPLFCNRVPQIIINESYVENVNIFLFYKQLYFGCLPLTGFLQSKIAWWYNLTFIEHIIATYSMISHDQSSPNIKQLNASVPTYFEDITMNKLLNEMLLEMSTNNNTHFDKFYDECAPIFCSYTINRRRDFIVVLFLLISICGGLNTGLQLLVPFIGKLFFFYVDWWKNRNVRHAIVERHVSKTLMSPSIDDYEQLLNIYSNDVSCPCSHISIPYQQFITELRVNSFHMACESNLIHDMLTTGQLFYGSAPVNGNNEYLSWMKPIIESLKGLCSLAKDSVENSIDIFLDSTILANQLTPRNQFINEMNSTLNQFKKRTPILFAQILDLFRSSIQGNALLPMFSSAWNLIVVEKDKGKMLLFSLCLLP